VGPDDEAARIHGNAATPQQFSIRGIAAQRLPVVAQGTGLALRTSRLLPTDDQFLPSELKALTTVFNQSDRHNRNRNSEKKKAPK
jgi:hypothetical protein